MLFTTRKYLNSYTYNNYRLCVRVVKEAVLRTAGIVASRVRIPSQVKLGKLMGNHKMIQMHFT